MEAVLQVLGGRHAVRPAPQNARDWSDRILSGLPSEAALAFKNSLKLTNDQLASLLGMSTRTVNRLSPKSSALTAVAGDRLYRSARIYSMAVDVLEDADAATFWMKSPQRALGNAIPLALVATDAGAREVEALLGRIEHGVYS